MLGRICLIWLTKKASSTFHLLHIALTDSIDRRAARHVPLCVPGYPVSDHSLVDVQSLNYDCRLEVTIWVVPSLFENAIAIACIGLLLGPMYPILMNYCTFVLPKWLLTGSVGWISGVGQAGSAVLPFVTGLLASKLGIGSLQPLYVLGLSFSTDRQFTDRDTASYQ